MLLNLLSNSYTHNSNPYFHEENRHLFSGNTNFPGTSKQEDKFLIFILPTVKLFQQKGCTFFFVEVKVASKQVEVLLGKLSERLNVFNIQCIFCHMILFTSNCMPNKFCLPCWQGDDLHIKQMCLYFWFFFSIPC